MTATAVATTQHAHTTPIRRWPYFATLAALALIAWLHTTCTPLIADDYHRAADMREQGLGATWRLAWSIGQNLDGRLPDHLVMLFFLALPKPIFNLANAAMTVILVVTALRLATGHWVRNAPIVAGFAALLWWSVPIYGQAFAWLTGACNYMWPAAISLIFLLPYFDLLRARAPRHPLVWCIALIPLGFWAGGGSETLGPAVWLLSLLTLLLARRFPLWGIIGFLSSLTGVLVQALQPGNLKRQRAGGDDPETNLILTLGPRVELMTQAMFERSWLAVLAGVCLAALAWAYRCGHKDAFRVGALLLLGAIAAHGTLILTPAFPGRSMCGTTVLLCTALAAALSEPVASSQSARAALTAGALVLSTMAAFSAAQAIAASAVCHEQNDRRIEAARSAGPDADLEVPRVITENPHVAWYGLEDWPAYDVQRWLGVHSVKAVDKPAK